jgi:hypothetical protein
MSTNDLIRDLSLIVEDLEFLLQSDHPSTDNKVAAIRQRAGSAVKVGVLVGVWLADEPKAPVAGGQAKV